MAIIEINKDPSRKELAGFAVAMAVFMAVMGWILHKHHPDAAVVLWWLAAPVAVAGAAAAWRLPRAMRLVYLAWMYAVYPIGWTISHLALAVVYYVAIVPIGLAMRLFGRDSMRRKFDRSATTYWQRREPADEPGRYFRQF